VGMMDSLSLVVMDRAVMDSLAAPWPSCVT
jgi:hypothetical protein